MKVFRGVSLILSILSVVGLGALAYAQNRGTLRVGLDLVVVPVTVTDPQNRHVTDLGPEHFEVFEDKVEQKVETFSTESVPISLGVIFDISHSMRDTIAAARDAAVALLRDSETTDEYFLIEFSDGADLTQDFTANVDHLENRIIMTVADGRTALYDAIYLGIEKVNAGKNPRKALLVITDGEDNHSRYSFSNIKQRLRESDVQIYGIGLNSGLGRAYLTQLSEISGGQVFFPDPAKELEAASRKITTQLKSQYVLGYISTNSSRDGKWRNIRVRVNPPTGSSRMTVRAKTGYYGPAS